MLDRREIFRVLREHRDLLVKYQVRKIGLFGSYALGKQKESSDIDFLIEFEQPTYDNFIGLIEELEKLLGKKVEILTPAGLESIRVKSVAGDVPPTVEIHSAGVAG